MTLFCCKNRCWELIKTRILWPEHTILKPKYFSVAKPYHFSSSFSFPLTPGTVFNVHSLPINVHCALLISIQAHGQRKDLSLKVHSRSHHMLFQNHILQVFSVTSEQFVHGKTGRKLDQNSPLMLWGGGHSNLEIPLPCKLQKMHYAVLLIVKLSSQKQSSFQGSMVFERLETQVIGSTMHATPCSLWYAKCMALTKNGDSAPQFQPLLHRMPRWSLRNILAALNILLLSLPFL